MSECARNPALTQAEAVGATSTSRLRHNTGSHALRNGRVSQAGNVYLVTTNTFERRPIFRSHHAGKCVIASIQHLHSAGKVESHACVVMPDHLHWLLTLQTESLSRLLQSLKTYSTKQINRETDHVGPVWQPGFHDHALRSEESLIELGNYLLANPIRAGLVGSLNEYPLWNCRWELGC